MSRKQDHVSTSYQCIRAAATAAANFSDRRSGSDHQALYKCNNLKCKVGIIISYEWITYLLKETGSFVLTNLPLQGQGTLY
ncbi:hypothetical protein Ahy_B09g099698 isoform J [Arachis hypogaea]|uniref:Uncharacterized protein n=1 Tax=Arachis hypogaea TaxID=3818 RepID=A0A444XVK2_ARAHY|nr:hypothetical protein Ahy_B09g099698 isoform J [Arachis hypogaea]